MKVLVQEVSSTAPMTSTGAPGRAHSRSQLGGTHTFLSMVIQQKSFVEFEDCEQAIIASRGIIVNEYAWHQFDVVPVAPNMNKALQDL